MTKPNISKSGADKPKPKKATNAELTARVKELEGKGLDRLNKSEARVKELEAEALEIAAAIEELETRVSEQAGSPAHAILDEDGNVQKLLIFDDPISRAVFEAISTTVQHPTGDVNDADYIPGWKADITKKVSAITGIRTAFVRVEFYDTDRMGVPLDDDNWVRIYVKVGDHERNTLLVDPTPED